jgi:FkbM family methyltransferase
LKKYAQALLKQIRLYQRLKSSFVYDLYWTFANKGLLEDRAKEVAFYRNTLQGFRTGSLIFDIGANQGHKTDIFLRLGAKVVSIDPDEANQDVLRQRFLKYRLKPKMVDVEGKAVSDVSTIKTLWIDAPGSAKNTLSPKWVDTLRNHEERFGYSIHFAFERKIQTTTIENLITTYGTPFFIKVDVEGHEVNVLRGMKQPVPYVSFEVNLPEFKLEGIECVRLLSQIAADGVFNYAVDCARGLLLERWLPPQEFTRVIEQCQAPSIEVFWRTCIPLD